MDAADAYCWDRVPELVGGGFSAETLQSYTGAMKRKNCERMIESSSFDVEVRHAGHAALPSVNRRTGCKTMINSWATVR